MEPKLPESEEVDAPRSASQLAMFQAVTAFEHAALRPLYLLNGGAAVAVLAFIGSIWASLGDDRQIVVDAAWSLGSFCFGLFSAGVATFAGYVSQQAFYKAGGAPRPIHRVVEPPGRPAPGANGFSFLSRRFDPGQCGGRIVIPAVIMTHS